MNVIGHEGWNALHYAAYYGHAPVVQCFLARAAQINKESLEGWTPLQLALLKHQSAVVALLLGDKQLDVNQQTRKGTALHVAAREGKLPELQQLLARNANPFLASPAGQTAFDVAKNPETFQALSAHRVPPGLREAAHARSQQTQLSKVPFGLKGYLHKVGRFQIQVNYRYLVLDPVEGTLSRYACEADCPHRPIEIVPLRCIYSLKKSAKRWYMKQHLFYFEVQYSSRWCLGAESEAVANVWLNAILKACLYAGQKHELQLQQMWPSHRREELQFLEVRRGDCLPGGVQNDAETFAYKKCVISECFQFRSTSK